MKKILNRLAILLVFAFVDTYTAVGQDIYTINNANPSNKIFNKNFFGGLSQSKYGNIDGAPRGLSFISSAMLSDNAGIGLDISTYSVGIFHKNQYYAKYAYKLNLNDNDEWFFGMGIGLSLDSYSIRYNELIWANPNNAILENENLLGSSAMAGFLLTNQKTFVSLYGEHTIIGLENSKQIDADMNMLINLEIAQRFKISEGLSLRTGIKTEFIDFNQFKSFSTLPITLDLSLKIAGILDIGFEGNNNYIKGRTFVTAKWLNIFYEYTADYGYDMLKNPTNTIGFIVNLEYLKHGYTMIRIDI